MKNTLKWLSFKNPRNSWRWSEREEIGERVGRFWKESSERRNYCIKFTDYRLKLCVTLVIFTPEYKLPPFPDIKDKESNLLTWELQDNYCTDSLHPVKFFYILYFNLWEIKLAKFFSKSIVLKTDFNISCLLSVAHCNFHLVDMHLWARIRLHRCSI